MGDSGLSGEQDKLGEITRDIYAEIAACRTQLSACERKVRALERHARAALRTRRQPRRQAAYRKPTGFAKPGKVSQALREFMSLPDDSLVARTEATRAVNAYIKQKNLQDPTDAKRIVPDERLSALLGLDPDSSSDQEPLTYFNIQAHMNRHFEKKATPSAQGE